MFASPLVPPFVVSASKLAAIAALSFALVTQTAGAQETTAPQKKTTIRRVEKKTTTRTTRETKTSPKTDDDSSDVRTSPVERTNENANDRTVEPNDTTSSNENVIEGTGGSSGESAPRKSDESVRTDEPVRSAPTSPVVTKSPVNAREDRPITVGWAGTILSIPIPFKHGPILSWSLDESWMLEASYFRGSIGIDVPYIDLGSFDESHISLRARWFAGRTFNLIVGLNRQSYDASVGNAIVSRVSGAPSELDMLHVVTLGVELGLGNRWQLDNGIVIGIDWLSLNFPFTTLKSDAPILDRVSDQGDRNRIEDALKFMRYLPTGTVGKVTLGYAF